MKSIPQTKECVDSVSIVLLTSSGKVDKPGAVSKPKRKMKKLTPKTFPYLFSKKKLLYFGTGADQVSNKKNLIRPYTLGWLLI